MEDGTDEAGSSLIERFPFWFGLGEDTLDDTFGALTQNVPGADQVSDRAVVLRLTNQRAITGAGC